MSSSPWKRPNEVMQLHKLRKKKKALQERMRQPLTNDKIYSDNKESAIDINKLLRIEKRKNPFSKDSVAIKEKKIKSEDVVSMQLDESNDKTLFKLLNLSSNNKNNNQTKINVVNNAEEKLTTFTNLLQQYSSDHIVEQVLDKCYNYLPIDWALKSKLRLMSPKPFGWNQRLKASEEASGITGFVRCLDTSDSNTLDTSYHSRFHQNCLYWQHPHLPWINVYPRSMGRAKSSSSFVVANEEVQLALHKEWIESFRSLFQLVRARQCPYFYVCANTFTCLFRAAGICGISETNVLISPTTRGFRQTLKQEDVEFTMPLKPNKKKLNNSDSQSEDDKCKNNSYDSCYDTMDDVKSQPEKSVTAASILDGDCSADEEDEDLASDQFLSKLGLHADQIKKINHSQARIQHASESSVDSAAESLVFVRGVDAQAIFNFLLNCKSIISPTGPFGGIPPTLLAPIAFQGGTLQTLQVRESTIHSDSKKYYSIEMRGPLLPTTIHTLFDLIKSNGNQFSATFAPQQGTVAFSKAAIAIHEDESTKENDTTMTSAFNKENLSDCGMSSSMLEHFCSSDPNYVKSVDSLKYNPIDNLYTW